MSKTSKKEILDDSTGPPPYFGAAYSDQAQNSPLISQPYHADATFVAVESNDPTKPVVQFNSCHVVWSIISFFLCNICGVVAIVMSVLSYVDHRTGDYNGYRRKRRCAVGFLVTGMILGACVISAYVVCKVVHGEEGGVTRMATFWRKHDDDDAY